MITSILNGADNRTKLIIWKGDKATLLATVTHLIPYIGYPRALNAVTCLNEVLPEK